MKLLINLFAVWIMLITGAEIQPPNQSSQSKLKILADDPSFQPTYAPSHVPTESPTYLPTFDPTVVPPSSYPSSSPTSSPTISHHPTSYPTTMPTGQPTRQPTSQPSRQPFGSPTGQPTCQPNSRPTAQPISLPTGQPTRQPTTQPSGQPSRQPSGQPSRQPTGQPSRQPTAQPSRQPTRRPSAQPTRHPTSQPSVSPTVALQIAIVASVSHGLYKANAYKFSQSSLSSTIFAQSVRDVTQLPEAMISIQKVWDSNFTYNVPSARQLLEVEGDEATLSLIDTQAISLAPSMMLLNYSIKFYTTDFSPVLSSEAAFTTFITRLNDSFRSNYLGTMINWNSREYNDFKLSGAFTNISLKVESSKFFRWEHSAFPSGVPSSSPSSQPSSQPSMSPTAMPSFSKQTKWDLRLAQELDDRFDVDERKNRAIYFEVDFANFTYYGGYDPWTTFTTKVVRQMTYTKSFSSFSLLTLNATFERTKVFTCEDPDVLRRMEGMFRGERHRNITVWCAGNYWQMAYCRVRDEAPSICVNCHNPCTVKCRTGSFGLQAYVSPTSHNCSLFYGNMRVVHIEMTSDVIDATYVPLSYGILWIVLFIIAALCIAFHTFSGWQIIRKHSTAMETNVEVTANVDDLAAAMASLSPSSINHMAATHTTKAADPDHAIKLRLIRKLNEEIFAPFMVYNSKVMRMFHAMFTRHRGLRMFANHSCGDKWYVLWLGTSLILHGLFLSGFMFGQFPYDNGQCAANTDQSSCEDERNSFLTFRSLCTWWNVAKPRDDIEFGVAKDYQTNCLLDSHDVTAKDVFRLAFVGIVFVSLTRILVLEPFLKRFIMPPLVDEAAENATTGNDAGEYMLEIKAASPANSPGKSNQVRGASSTNQPAVELKLVPRRQTGGSAFHELDQPEFVSSVAEDEYFQYELALQGGGNNNNKNNSNANTFQSHSDSNAGNEVGSGVAGGWRQFMSMLGQLTGNKDSALPVTQGKLNFQVEPRSPNQFAEEAFRRFYSHLLAHRKGYQEKADLRRFDHLWGIRRGEFSEDRVVLRSFSWQLANHLQVSQPVGDYFREYVNCVHRVATEERAAARRSPGKLLRTRILFLFVLDVMGHLSHEARQMRRRSFRDYSPRAPVFLYSKAVAVAFLFAVDAVLIAMMWYVVRNFTQKVMRSWYSAILVAMVLDFLVIENLDNIWCYCVVPATCLRTFHCVKEDLAYFIMHGSFAAAPVKLSPGKKQQSQMLPVRSYTATIDDASGSGTVRSRPSPRPYPMARLTSSQWRHTLGPSGSVDLTATAKSIQAGGLVIGSQFSADAGSTVVAHSKPFDAPDYLFVSKRFARLFPTWPESQLVMQYHVNTPRRLVVGKWYHANEMITKRVSWMQCISNCCNPFPVIDNTPADQKPLAMPPVNLTQSMILWIGEFPSSVQRILVMGIGIGIMYLVWMAIELTVNYFSYTIFWAISGSALVVFFLGALLMVSYFYFPEMHFTLDEAHKSWWLRWLLRPEEFPSEDEAHRRVGYLSDQLTQEDEHGMKIGNLDGDAFSDISSLSGSEDDDGEEDEEGDVEERGEGDHDGSVQPFTPTVPHHGEDGMAEIPQTRGTDTWETVYTRPLLEQQSSSTFVAPMSAGGVPMQHQQQMGGTGHMSTYADKPWQLVDVDDGNAAREAMEAELARKRPRAVKGLLDAQKKQEELNSALKKQQLEWERWQEEQHQLELEQAAREEEEEYLRQMQYQQQQEQLAAEELMRQQAEAKDSYHSPSYMKARSPSSKVGRSAAAMQQSGGGKQSSTKVTKAQAASMQTTPAKRPAQQQQQPGTSMKNKGAPMGQGKGKSTAPVR